MKQYTLKEICEICGVTRRAVQGYENEGLVKPCAKNKMGYLLYDEEALNTVSRIHRYQNFGFTLREISVAFRLDRRALRSRLAEKEAELRRRRGEMDRTLAELEDEIRQLSK